MDKLIEEHYTGHKAQTYNNRSNNHKWGFEQRIVETFIREHEDVETIIDAPLGTNRFSLVIENSSHIKSVDGYEYSDDMIAEARKPISSKLKIHKWNLVTDAIEKKGDLSLIIRMLNLFPEEQSLSILNNILVATEKYSIVTLRCWAQPHKLTADNKIHVQNEQRFVQEINDLGFRIIDERFTSTVVDGTYKIFILERI